MLLAAMKMDSIKRKHEFGDGEFYLKRSRHDLPLLRRDQHGRDMAKVAKAESVTKIMELLEVLITLIFELCFLLVLWWHLSSGSVVTLYMHK